MAKEQTGTEGVILRLEHCKHFLKDCRSQTNLLAAIDMAMETLIDYQSFASPDLLLANGDIITRLHYLRELRAIALDLAEEQVGDFCRDLSLIISSMQFQLWDGQSQDLISLIHSTESLKAG